jgi:hypothetical protein
LKIPLVVDSIGWFGKVPTVIRGKSDQSMLSRDFVEGRTNFMAFLVNAACVKVEFTLRFVLILFSLTIVYIKNVVRCSSSLRLW